MKINYNDYLDIKFYLEDRYKYGKEFVVFPIDKCPVLKEDLTAYYDQRYALECCFAKSTEFKLYAYKADH